MSTPLASFFTKIGFEVDPSALKKVENTFDRLQKQAQSMAKALQTPTQRMQERLNVSAMRQQVLMQEKKNQAILNQINESKNLVRQRERENKLDDASRRHSMFMEKSLERRQQIVAKTAELSERARMKATPYAQRTRTGVSESSPSGGVSDPLFTVGNLKTAAAFEGLRRFGVQSYNLGNIQMGQQPQFEYITGSAEEATKQIDFLNKEVDRLGLNLLDANVQYRQLFAAAGKTLGTKDTQTLFTNFQNMATMLGLSTDAQNRGIRAFQQMISKGQVMAEELKGQLAEAMPGAVGLFADALYGDGTQGSGDQAKLFKDMEAGKVKLDEIRKVIQYMGTLTKEDLISRMLNTPEKKLNKLRNAWHRFVMQINDAGVLDAMIFILESITKGIEYLTIALKPIIVLFRNLWSHTKDLFNLLSSFSGLLGGIFFKNLTTTALTLGLVLLNFNRLLVAVPKLAGILSMLWKRLLIPAAITSGLLLIEDLIFALKGQGSVLADLAKDGEGFASVLAKIVISIGSIVQFVLGLGFSLYDRLFGTGDWGYLEEVFNTFRQQMNDLFPFDMWFANFRELGKLVLGVMNPMTAMGAIAEYSRFKEASANWNQQSAMKSPALLARPNPYVSSGGYTAPTPATINFNPSITINGSGLNQSQLESTINNVLNKQVTQAKANYSMAR